MKKYIFTVLSALFLLLLPVAYAQQIIGGGGGVGVGAANVTATCAGTVTTCAVNITSLALTSTTIKTALVQCFVTATGADLPITGYTTSGGPPLTTLTPTFASTTGVFCTVNSNGGAGATGPTGAVGATGATGPAGTAGATGPTGASGTAGATGATGATGAAGSFGLSSLQTSSFSQSCSTHNNSNTQISGSSIVATMLANCAAAVNFTVTNVGSSDIILRFTTNSATHSFNGASPSSADVTVPACSTAPGCPWVSLQSDGTGNWIERDGTGSGTGTSTGAFGLETAITIGCGATQNINLADVSVKSPVGQEPCVLTQNTAFTVTNKTAGASTVVAIIQSAGNWVPTWDASVIGACPILTSGVTTWVPLSVAADGTTVNAGICHRSDGATLFPGSTSGTVGLQASAVAGNWTLTLPTGAGSSNQFLQTNGSGVTTWAPAGTVTSITAGTGLTGGTITTTGTVALDTSYTNGLYPQLAAASTFSAGAKQVFTPSATTAGMRVVAGAIPSSQAAGDFSVSTTGSLNLFDGTNIQRMVNLAGSGVTPPTLAKGDIPCATGTASFLNLGVGSNTQTLVADSTQTCGVKWAVAVPATVQTRAISFTIGDPAGSALTAASTTTDYITVPFACTISAYNLLIDAGTITVKFWKVATGTAIPTSGNSINTSGVGIASGTAIHSTTVSDFTTTTVTANDIIAMNVTAVATAKLVNGVLQCNQ